LNGYDSYEQSFELPQLSKSLWIFVEDFCELLACLILFPPMHLCLLIGDCPMGWNLDDN
jgi:hypothetical protein